MNNPPPRRRPIDFFFVPAEEGKKFELVHGHFLKLVDCWNENLVWKCENRLTGYNLTYVSVAYRDFKTTLEDMYFSLTENELTDDLPGFPNGPIDTSIIGPIIEAVTFKQFVTIYNLFEIKVVLANGRVLGYWARKFDAAAKAIQDWWIRLYYDPQSNAAGAFANGALSEHIDAAIAYHQAKRQKRGE